MEPQPQIDDVAVTAAPPEPQPSPCVTTAPATPVPLVSTARTTLARAKVESAFRSAETSLGAGSRLTGKGHDKRVVLRREISGPASIGAPESFAKLTNGRVFSAEVVAFAASELGVTIDEIMMPPKGRHSGNSAGNASGSVSATTEVLA